MENEMKNAAQNAENMEPLTEEQLKHVSGGVNSDKYDPDVCTGLTRTHSLCIGCIHYVRRSGSAMPPPPFNVPPNGYSHSCKKMPPAFRPYVGDANGNPR